MGGCAQKGKAYNIRRLDWILYTVGAIEGFRAGRDVITGERWHGSHDTGACTEFLLGHPVLRLQVGLAGSWGQGAASSLWTFEDSLWAQKPREGIYIHGFRVSSAGISSILMGNPTLPLWPPLAPMPATP